MVHKKIWKQTTNAKASLNLQFFLLIYVSYSSLVAYRSRSITSPQPIYGILVCTTVYINIISYAQSKQSIQNIICSYFTFVQSVCNVLYIVWNHASTRAYSIRLSIIPYELQCDISNLQHLCMTYIIKSFLLLDNNADSDWSTYY